MKPIIISGEKYFLDYLNYNYINKLILFNKEIISNLDVKSYFIAPNKSELHNYLIKKSKVFLLFKKDKLIAYAALTFHQESYENWIVDFNLKKSDLKFVAKLDSIAISNKYRSKHIFSFFEKKFVNFLINNNYNLIVAHVHPNNKNSLNYFLNHDYLILKKGHFRKSVRFFLIKKLK